MVHHRAAADFAANPDSCFALAPLDDFPLLPPPFRSGIAFGKAGAIILLLLKEKQAHTGGPITDYSTNRRITVVVISINPQV
jgi:hypothetical protein